MNASPRPSWSPAFVVAACVVPLLAGCAARQPRGGLQVEPATATVRVVDLQGKEQPQKLLARMPSISESPRLQVVTHPRADQATPERGTELLDINDAGQIVGGFIDRRGVVRGVYIPNMRDPSRLFDIEIAGATFTRSYAINNKGLIVGTYRDRAGVYRGFRLTVTEVEAANGKPIQLREDRAIDLGGRNTQGLGVNDMNTVVGGYLTEDGQIRAYMQRDGQRPEPLEFSRGGFTTAFDITSDGVIVAAYGEVNRETGYFMRSRTVLLGPKSMLLADFDVNHPVTNSGLGINDRYEIAGIAGAGATCSGNVSFYQMVSNPNPVEAGSAQLMDVRAMISIDNRRTTAVSKINNKGMFVGASDGLNGSLVGVIGEFGAQF